MFGELLRDNVWFGNQQMCIKPTLHIFKTAPCKWCFSLLRLPVYNTWTYVTQFGQNRLFLSWGAHSGLTAVSVCCTWRVVICQGDHCFCWVRNIYIHPVTVCVLFVYSNLKKKRLLWVGIIKSAYSFFCLVMLWTGREGMHIVDPLISMPSCPLFVWYDNLNYTIMHFAWCLLLICWKTDVCMMLQLKTFCFFTILNKNRLYVAVHLYSNRS